MDNFPEKIYGRCPLGHNIAPSGTAGDNISPTQISEGESQPLFWSGYWQDYVCAFHLRREEDEINDIIFTERDREQEKKRQSMGFVKKSSYSVTEP